MTITELIKIITKKADDTGLGQKQVRKILMLFKHEILAHVKKSSNFNWKGFFSIRYSDRKSCELLHPKTRKAVKVRSMKVASLKLSDTCRRIANED